MRARARACVLKEDGICACVLVGVCVRARLGMMQERPREGREGRRDGSREAGAASPPPIRVSRRQTIRVSRKQTIQVSRRQTIRVNRKQTIQVRQR